MSHDDKNGHEIPCPLCGSVPWNRSVKQPTTGLLASPGRRWIEGKFGSGHWCDGETCLLCGDNKSATPSAERSQEPAAFTMKNEKGLTISITTEDLARQPEWIKKLWANAAPLYAAPSSASPSNAPDWRLNWALAALSLVANGLKNRRGLTDDDVEMKNLAAARLSIENIKSDVSASVPTLVCPRCGDDWQGQACVSDCPLWKMARTDGRGA